MRTEDVTDTLDLALAASGCGQVHVAHKPRLLSDNGSSYVSAELAEWLQGKGMKRPPSIKRLLRHSDRAHRFRYRHPLSLQNFNLLKLRYNFFGLFSFASHH
jgi:transposase InsO family protein